jgi:hypothetical protein
LRCEPSCHAQKERAVSGAQIQKRARLCIRKAARQRACHDAPLQHGGVYPLDIPPGPDCAGIFGRESIQQIGSEALSVEHQGTTPLLALLNITTGVPHGSRSLVMETSRDGDMTRCVDRGPQIIKGTSSKALDRRTIPIADSPAAHGSEPVKFHVTAIMHWFAASSSRRSSVYFTILRQLGTKGTSDLEIAPMMTKSLNVDNYLSKRLVLQPFTPLL